MGEIISSGDGSADRLTLNDIRRWGGEVIEQYPGAINDVGLILEQIKRGDRTLSGALTVLLEIGSLHGEVALHDANRILGDIPNEQLELNLD